jgi:hypothetical protein
MYGYSDMCCNEVILYYILHYFALRSRCGSHVRLIECASEHTYPKQRMLGFNSWLATALDDFVLLVSIDSEHSCARVPSLPVICKEQ